MKNKILLRALILSLCAFIWYGHNLRTVENASVKIITPKKTNINKTQQKEPTLDTTETQQNTAKDVSVKSGSNKSLVTIIQKAMSKSGSYQVAVQDLNNPAKFAQLYTTSASQSAAGIMRLNVLTGIYKKEQEHKLARGTNIKIEKSDKVKGDKLLQVGMQYSIAYLRQAMMRQNNKTAANALLRVAGKNTINQVAKKYGAKDTVINSDFNSKVIGKTTAADLDSIMKGLYQAKVLNRQNAQLVLSALHGSNTPLTKQINGTIYSVGGKNFATAIVQNAGKSYAISVWSPNDSNFDELGLAVSKWFNQNR